MPQPLGTMSPRAQAWLRLINYAEGTDKHPNAYSTAFGGSRFDNSLPHSGTVYTSSSGRRSDAAGAYQFKKDSWIDANGGVNAPMTKENQDKAALWLIQNRGGFDPNSTPVSKSAVSRLSGTWASLPNAQGVSAYNQPVKSYAELEKVFNQANPPNPKVSDIFKYPDANQVSPIFKTNKMGKRYKPNSANGDLQIVPDKGKNSGKGLSNFEQKAIKAMSVATQAFNPKLDLGSTLNISNLNSNYNWQSTAPASTSWMAGFKIPSLI